MSETRYRPKMRFYHPNLSGTGCALSLELLPADGTNEGCIMATLAGQASVGSRQGPNLTYSTFNWEGAVTVKLGFVDLCKILQVLRGECESIDDGKGLYHRSASGSAKISFRHLVEPISGYVLEVHRVPDGDGQDVRLHIVLAPWEATGLAESIAGSMSVICFGVPTPRLSSAKKTAGAGDEAA